MRFFGDRLELLDQRSLPRDERWVVCRSAADVAEAIRAMVVRGAPAIGIAAAYGVAIADARGEDRALAHDVLLQSRPTAVNLQWAIARLRGLTGPALQDAAKAIHQEDVRINQAIGQHGAALLPAQANIYHHCNTGTLATGGWGTALGIIRSAHEEGRLAHVWVGETRPYLQGARLTAYELKVEKVPCTLVTDSTAAALMAAGKIDAVTVGCDRVAANGDTANKIGTLGLAVLAKHYGVPFYVAMPMSTLDPNCPDGTHIPIEERSASEVLGYGDVRWAADVPVYNPSFDVTPAALITAWVTEHGLWTPPDR
jgi:methylthioribose-1-phosphate isomerase